MSALTGFRALCHFDLDFLCADQIAAGHAEPSARHLLDRGAAIQSVRPHRHALDILAALAGVALAVQHIHGDCHGFMRFLGDRAVGHGSRLESGHDGFHAFHFLQRNAFFRIFEVHEPAQVLDGILVIHKCGILLEHFVITAFCGFLQKMDGRRIIQMLLRAAAHLVMPRAVKRQIRGKSQRIKRLGMQFIHLSLNILYGDAAHTADRVGEILVDHFPVNADRLKNLGALIGLDGADSHFGSDLDNTVQHRVVVIVNGCIVVLVQHVIVDQFLDGLLCKIGIDRAGTIAQKGGKMMHLPRLTGLQNNCHSGSLFRAHKVLMQGGNGKQRRNRHMVLVHASVREDQHIDAVPVRSVHLHKEPVDRLLQTGIFIVDDGDHFHAEAVLLHVLDLQKIRVGQDRIVDLQHIAVLRHFLQHVSLPSHIDGGRGHDLLPYGVNGRVGHLGKQLLEIMEQRMMCLAQHRQRRIHSHGGNGFRTVLRHRKNAGL